jgi:hypothetical protein
LVIAVLAVTTGDALEEVDNRTLPAPVGVSVLTEVVFAVFFTVFIGIPEIAGGG